MYKARNDWDIIQEARHRKVPKKHVARYMIRIPVDKKSYVSQTYDEPVEYAEIFVGNISPSTTKDQVYELFRQFGEVSDVFIPIDFTTKSNKGYAFVQFEEKPSAEKSIAFSLKIILNERKLYMNWATPREKK